MMHDARSIRSDDILRRHMTGIHKPCFSKKLGLRTQHDNHCHAPQSKISGMRDASQPYDIIRTQRKLWKEKIHIS